MILHLSIFYINVRVDCQVSTNVRNWITTKSKLNRNRYYVNIPRYSSCYSDNYKQDYIEVATYCTDEKNISYQKVFSKSLIKATFCSKSFFTGTRGNQWSEDHWKTNMFLATPRICFRKITSSYNEYTAQYSVPTPGYRVPLNSNKITNFKVYTRTTQVTR